MPSMLRFIEPNVTGARYQSAFEEGKGQLREVPVKSNTFPAQASSAPLQARAARPNRLEAGTSSTMTAVRGWSIALLISAGLWWAAWWTVSTLVSALL
jgi:hypothetical protein